jgi:hypothetical protein
MASYVCGNLVNSHQALLGVRMTQNVEFLLSALLAKITSSIFAIREWIVICCSNLTDITW